MMNLSPLKERYSGLDLMIFYMVCKTIERGSMDKGTIAAIVVLTAISCASSFLKSNRQ